QPKAPHGRIQGCEELVTCRHVRAGQRVEQRRFARVSVADKRDYRERNALSRASMQTSGPPNLMQILFQPNQPFVDQPAVGFDLRLARSAEKAETTTLAFEMGPGTNKP